MEKNGIEKIKKEKAEQEAIHKSALYYDLPFIDLSFSFLYKQLIHIHICVLCLWLKRTHNKEHANASGEIGLMTWDNAHIYQKHSNTAQVNHYLRPNI